MRSADSSRRFYGRCAAAVALAVGWIGSAFAAGISDPTVEDKSGFTLLNPTPREWMREMSTDRPDTTESPYTVDAGHVQLELSFVDYTHDRHNEESVTTRSLAVAPLLVKVGLLNSVDLQVGLDPYTRTRTTDRISGDSETADGFGDTIVRLKVNLWGNDDGPTAGAIMPFVKLPTVSGGLGNGDIEGGLILPLAIALGEEFDLGMMVEFDINRNGVDERYVAEFVHTVTLGHALAGNLNGYVEYAGFANLSHDEEYRGYFDAGLTYAITPDHQLDAGIRVGLTEAADDLGMFVGLSLRF